jgi:hypothetical protein
MMKKVGKAAMGYSLFVSLKLCLKNKNLKMVVCNMYISIHDKIIIRLFEKKKMTQQPKKLWLH